MTRGLLRAVQLASGGRCDYCRTPEHLDPLPFQVDHIISIQHGGPTVLSNLAWSCLHCNKHKGPNIAGIDPETGQLVGLFHPRRQSWNRHFEWDGPVLVGRTRSGRATIVVLAINHPNVLEVRAEFFHEGAWLI